MICVTCLVCTRPLKRWTPGLAKLCVRVIVLFVLIPFSIAFVFQAGQGIEQCKEGTVLSFSWSLILARIAFLSELGQCYRHGISQISQYLK
jgi:hypothetical protein